MPKENSSATDEDELLASVVSEAVKIPNLDMTLFNRFTVEVHKLVETRASGLWASENNSDQAAVFVLVDVPRLPFGFDSLQNDKLSQVIDLPFSGDPIFGKIFFLSPNASNGTCMVIDCDINDILVWLIEKGLTSNPVLIAHRGSKKLSAREVADDDEPTYLDIRDSQPELSHESLSHALSLFHQRLMITPTTCGPRIWEPGRSGEYVPSKNTEKEIQAKMRVSLLSYFRGQVRVGEEDTVDKGRIDVRLLTSGATNNGLKGLTYWSIVELKVVRSFANQKKAKKNKPKTPLKAVSISRIESELVKGVQQADEFTEDREVEQGFLEIFDMRTVQAKKVDLLELPKVAAALKSCTREVKASVRPMYGSSEHARQAGYLSA